MVAIVALQVKIGAELKKVERSGQIPFNDIRHGPPRIYTNIMTLPMILPEKQIDRA